MRSIGRVLFGHTYDASGRQTSMTVPNQSTVTYGIDERFSRSDGTGTTHYLTDALGSTLALAAASGCLQTPYTYEPFGATTQSGTGTANAVRYTGREEDGTGLYYYRARYYDIEAPPVRKRGSDSSRRR
jgi:hypothetical protein